MQEHICAYCGGEAQYQLKNGKWCCQKRPSMCPAIREKNSSGLKKAYQSGIRDAKEIYQNKSQQSKRNSAWSRGKTKFDCEILRIKGQLLSNRYKNGELTPSQLGRKHTSEEIDRIMRGMTGVERKFKHGDKGYRRGYYKGYWCDSAWELAFVMYNLDHNIKFERNTKFSIEYEYKDRIRKFYPDFKMNDGTYVQIKGWMGQQNQIKMKVAKEQLGDKFKILSKEDMKKTYLPYVFEVYGNNFYELYNN